MRHLFLLLVLFGALSLFALPIYAEDFSLTHIGALETKDKKFNQWWYMPQNVVFKGTGSRGANIDITLDGTFNTVKASVDNGKWEFKPEKPLTVADHTVTIASGSQSYSFILTIGSEAPASAQNATSKGGMPQAGILFPLLGLIGLAGLFVVYGLKKA